MSADSAVTYTSIHSKARSWSIPSEDPNEEADRQLLEQAHILRRVTYQVDVCTRESSEFCTRHHDAQTDRAAVRAEIEDLARSEAHCRALEARVTVLETDARRHEWQRQAADDLAVQHIMRTQALEAGARVDTLEDTENGTKSTTRSTEFTVRNSNEKHNHLSVTEAHSGLIDQGVAVGNERGDKIEKISVDCPYDNWQCKASKSKDHAEVIEFN
ncbi:hypothetical protein Tco_0841027 [Tanacetum coccineum]|uniref:Uncharacterized protein n=1 Tax=Tanacetum coccineum TaxID=301880 RepID=A0ABQ5AV91_9ASTR